MSRISAYSGGLVACLCVGTILGQDQVPGQLLEEVRQYQSGEARVTVECFSPAVTGKFPAVLLLHGSGGLELATVDLFSEKHLKSRPPKRRRSATKQKGTQAPESGSI